MQLGHHFLHLSHQLRLSQGLRMILRLLSCPLPLRNSKNLLVHLLNPHITLLKLVEVAVAVA
jgi:hypothetical protein